MYYVYADLLTCVFLVDSCRTSALSGFSLHCLWLGAPVRQTSTDCSSTCATRETVFCSARLFGKPALIAPQLLQLLQLSAVAVALQPFSDSFVKVFAFRACLAAKALITPQCAIPKH